MKTFDYLGVDVFAENGSGHIITLCNECMEGATFDVEVDPMPIFADSELDYYPECEACGVVFDYINLTEYGMEELKMMKEMEES